MEKKLVDLNVASLKDRDLEWADVVFLGGMNIQINPFERSFGAAKLGAQGGWLAGPLVTSNPEQFPRWIILFSTKPKSPCRPLSPISATALPIGLSHNDSRI
jgi:hypothetical protein